MADSSFKLTFVPAPDEPAVSDPAYQAEIRHFIEEVDSQGIEIRSSGLLQESATNSGWEYGIFTLASTLGPVALVQLRKAVETFLKAREGRKLKVTVGDVTVEGAASEVSKLITPEQISKMLDAQKNTPKKNLHD